MTLYKITTIEVAPTEFSGEYLVKATIRDTDTGEPPFVITTPFNSNEEDALWDVLNVALDESLAP